VSTKLHLIGALSVIGANLIAIEVRGAGGYCLVRPEIKGRLGIVTSFLTARPPLPGVGSLKRDKQLHRITNGRLRDECLNVEVFFALADVLEKLERWRQDYNQVRPHSALRDSAPAVFAAQWAETAAPGPEPVPARAGKPAAGNSLELLT
jgi:hypothetical protein